MVTKSVYTSKDWFSLSRAYSSWFKRWEHNALIICHMCEHAHEIQKKMHTSVDKRTVKFVQTYARTHTHTHFMYILYYIYTKSQNTHTYTYMYIRIYILYTTYIGLLAVSFILCFFFVYLQCDHDPNSRMTSIFWGFLFTESVDGTSPWHRFNITSTRSLGHSASLLFQHPVEFGSFLAIPDPKSTPIYINLQEKSEKSTTSNHF